MLQVRIFYAQLAEDSVDSRIPAALEYSRRAALRLDGRTATKSTTAVTVEPLPVDCRQIDDVDDSTGSGRCVKLFLFVLSCAADGTVHRSVRKFVRSLPKEGNSERALKSSSCAVALLGHARCDNSAKQMEDTIYGAGRRLEKALHQSSLFDAVPKVAVQTRCETQVELEGPEERFDEWVGQLFQEAEVLSL